MVQNSFKNLSYLVSKQGQMFSPTMVQWFLKYAEQFCVRRF